MFQALSHLVEVVNNLLKQVNVEDNTNHFGFHGFYDSFPGSSWGACIPMELLQYISNSHLCSSWLFPSMVKCFDARVSAKYARF